MCMFNTGCPGWMDVPGCKDGYTECNEELGCATGVMKSAQDIREYPIESHGRFDRYATGKETSVWVCGDCGEECDPDDHDEECTVEDVTYYPPSRNR